MFGFRTSGGLSLGQKLGGVLLLPLALAGYLISKDVYSSYRQIEEIENVKTLPSYFEGMSNAIHELQKERGMSAGFLSSKGQKFATQLKQQQLLVDNAIVALNEVRNSVTSTLHAGIDSVLARAGELTSTRRRVAAQTISVGDTISTYSGVIAEILNQVGAVSRTVDNGEIAGMAAGFHSILNIKESAGVERALLASV
ncbi:MAG: nitrate- and nitrite sensing domain-containing protein, partial [Pseudomonadota bacterium]